jgi:hypothetical protein
MHRLIERRISTSEMRFETSSERYIKKARKTCMTADVATYFG